MSDAVPAGVLRSRVIGLAILGARCTADCSKEGCMGSWDPTHALTLNGGASVTEVCKLLDPEAMLRRVLSGMDGQQEFAVSLARFPEGTRLWDPRASGWPLCFLQAAGAATAMMVEVSQFDASGELGLYKLGCRGSDEQGAAQLEV
ncbi:MAG: hypothetical protein E6375_03825, partial [Dermabacter sp.]|nr:hypothetical protein [Dermabacter sp.]